jgi:hypothetical protein
MEQAASRIESDILEAVYGEQGAAVAERIPLYGFAALPVLAEHLSTDLPIETLEKFEALLKRVLRSNLSGAISGEIARQIALFQKRVGFLFKYKSYTIKAASPLGYSVFTHNPREGFSFQRHVTHKTEAFHILEVMPGGYVFICDYDEWVKLYDEESFAAWVAGRSDARYDRFRFDPLPGDLFIINELGVVHSVIGCALEEYATVSTDMVDRLHDQNAGRSVPPHFNRAYAGERLGKISYPSASRLVRAGSEPEVSEIAPVEIRGGRMVKLARTAVKATRYVIERAKASDMFYDPARAASIHVTAGRGQVILGELEEVRRLSPPAIEVAAGDLLMIPAGAHYGFVSEGGDELTLSEHKIPFDVAFI